MRGLSSSEQGAVERAAAEPMLDQVLGLVGGQQRVAQSRRARADGRPARRCLLGAPGELGSSIRRRSRRSIPAGKTIELGHGRNLHLTVRPDAPLQLLFTGHMDTVFAADHAFQETRWLEDGVLNGPGVADMKGGLAVMLAALKAVEASGADRIGYEVVINSDEEVGSLGFGSADRRRPRAGKRAALTYEPAALARRDARRRAAGQRQFRDRRRTAARRMPGAIPRTGATRCSPPRTWRSGSMG